jgi:integrase
MAPQPPPAVPLSALRPLPVSGHLTRVKRDSGDRWRVKWRDAAGVEHKKVLGRVWTHKGPPREGYLTKNEARRMLDELLAQARRVGPGARRADSRSLTFADAAAEWLRYVEVDRKRSANTLRDYRRTVEQVLLPTFGQLPLSELTSEMIDAFRAHHVDERRLTARTINKYLVVINGILKRAQRHYGLAVNVAAGVERQPVRRATEFRVLSIDEVELLARTFADGAHHPVAQRTLTNAELAARSASDAQDAALILAAAYAGLRLGELRALRWRDVDFALRIVHVRRSFSLAIEDVPKSGRARAVPMADQVARALDALSRRDAFTGTDELVFPNPAGGFLEDSALRRRYYAALQAAGITHLRFHDLRHTFGTLAVQEFALSDVKAYMGHADIATTMIYVHHVPQHDAADRLSARLAKTSTAAAALDRAVHDADGRPAS